MIWRMAASPLLGPFGWFLGVTVNSYVTGRPASVWQLWGGVAFTALIFAVDSTVRAVVRRRPTHKIVKQFHHDGTQCIPDDFDDLRYHEPRPEDGHL